MRPHWVYILLCSDDTFYTGSTSNPELRYWQHCNGIGSAYTKIRRPLKMVYCQEFPDPYQAAMMERKVKNWSQAKKRALIAGQFEVLRLLARRKKD